TFGTELGTVLEEIARAADDPNRASWAALRGLLFGAHPYGTPVLGRGEHVAGATPADAESFFRAGHGARNLVVCLAGHLEPDRALSLLEKTLGQLPSGRRRPGPLGEPPALRGEHRVTLQHEAEPEVRIAWRGVSANHPDHHALLLADMLLDNRAGGLLRRRLVHTHRVRAAGSVRMTLREAGAHVLWARPLEGQEPAEVEGLLLDGVAALQAGEFTAAEVRAILKNFDVGELRRLEDPGPRAARLVRAVAWERDLAAVYAWRAPLEAVTPEDVIRVARRYLGPDRVVLHRTRGAPPPTRVVRASAGARVMAEHAQSAFAAEIMAKPAPVSRVQVLREGTDFTVRQDDWGETVLAAGPTDGLSRLSLRVPFGTHHAATWAHAVHLLDQSGAGPRSRGETEDALYRLGVSWDISPGRVATDVVVDGPSNAHEDALLLLGERISSPRIEPAEAAARMEELLLRRREGRTSRRVRGSALDRWVLRGEESEYRSGAPDAASLRALASAPLGAQLALLRTLPMNAVLTGAGPVERRVRALWKGGAVAPVDPPVRYCSAEVDRVFLCHQAGAQARVALLCPGPPVPRDGAQDAARRVWDEILGGAANLFFQEIREARGLAYSTRGRASRGRSPDDDTVLWAVTMCDAVRVAEVA
ncbi:MAG: insulinase family protein, partial [Myxococcota bacterium]|nr:insulinase family protein [Myxococcota bacterium]